jgi:DNA-binding transcriptional regulator/RsmH inhibitor MraZ
MLKGSSIATIDKFGRIRIPTIFKTAIEQAYGNEVFLTSLDGKTMEVFPLQEWVDLSAVPDEKLKDTAVREFLLRANRNGTRTTIDKWGRIALPKWLKDKTGLEGELEVEGVGDRLVLKKRDGIS